jgi:hypothetical protein
VRGLLGYGRSLAELNRAQLWFAPYMTGQPVVPAKAAEGRKWIVEDFDLLSAIRFRRDGSLKLKY